MWLSVYAPLAVPTHQGVGQGFQYVESSTTDSGVSNASSVTSDCVSQLIGEASLAETELPLPLELMQGVLRSRGTGEGARVSELPVSSLGSEEEERGERDEVNGTEGDELSDELRRLNVEGRRGESWLFTCPWESSVCFSWKRESFQPPMNVTIFGKVSCSLYGLYRFSYILCVCS